jgi:hypothetical protein
MPSLYPAKTPPNKHHPSHSSIHLCGSAVTVPTRPLWQAYFLRTMHVDPSNVKKLVIITNKWHMPRTKAIFQKVIHYYCCRCRCGGGLLRWQSKPPSSS